MLEQLSDPAGCSFLPLLVFTKPLNKNKLLVGSISIQAIYPSSTLTDQVIDYVHAIKPHCLVCRGLFCGMVLIQWPSFGSISHRRLLFVSLHQISRNKMAESCCSHIGKSRIGIENPYLPRSPLTLAFWSKLDPLSFLHYWVTSRWVMSDLSWSPMLSR